MSEKILVFREKDESPSDDGFNLTLVIKRDLKESLLDGILAEFNLYNMEPYSFPEERINLELNLFQMEEKVNL